MSDTLLKATKTINNLELTILIISNLINKETNDYYSIGEQVMKLLYMKHIVESCKFIYFIDDVIFIN